MMTKIVHDCKVAIAPVSSVKRTEELGADYKGTRHVLLRRLRSTGERTYAFGSLYDCITGAEFLRKNMTIEDAVNMALDKGATVYAFDSFDEMLLWATEPYKPYEKKGE